MDLNYLTLDIKYYTSIDKFEVGGNVNREGQSELVESFLRSQIGAGMDHSKANKQDEYNIRLRWHPSDDRIESYSDTGNMALRDGILTYFLGTLNE